MISYGPYSPIRQADNFYFISGQVGIDPQTKLAAKDIKQQTVQTLENMKSLLAAHGLTLDKVIKTTVYLKNMTRFKDMNEVYTKYFNEPRPARSCVEVSALPKLAVNELLIEIEDVAYKP